MTAWRREFHSEFGAVLVQSGYLFLSDGRGLLQLPKFCLQLLNLVFVPPLFLFALILRRLAVVFQRLPGMAVHLFQRCTV